MDKKTILGLVATAILIVVAMVYLPFPAGPVGAQSEAETNELRGWAWSGSTGWVSFNSKDYDAAGVDYKVEIDGSNNLTGYAWSLNLGWIKFEPGSSFAPSDCNTGDCYGAKIVERGDVDEVKGWARACSVFQSGCSGALRPNSQLGGWDGWIQMNNVTRQANGAFHGYAWGDLNLAWLDFGFNNDDDNSNDDECVPLEEVCGPGGGDDCDQYEEGTLDYICCMDDSDPRCPGNGDNTVSVAVENNCGGGLTIVFSPSGDSCSDDEETENCRLYPMGDSVDVTISGNPEGTNLVISGACNENPCSLNDIQEHKVVNVSCPTTNIGDCKPKLTGGNILQLIEDSYLDYSGGVLSDTFAELSLLNIYTNADCGLNYDLSSETSDPNVQIVCESATGYGICNNLDGSGKTKVKARFMMRPTEPNKTWNVTFTASSAGIPSLSNVYNSLIRYYRRIGN